MNLMNKACMAASLLVASFSAFAHQDIPCPSVAEALNATELLDTVSLVDKTDDMGQSYFFVFNLTPMETPTRWWHFATSAVAPSMVKAIGYGKEVVKNATESVTEVAAELGPFIICGYKTPLDKGEDVSILAFSLTIEGKETDPSVLKSLLKMPKNGGKPTFMFKHK